MCTRETSDRGVQRNNDLCEVELRFRKAELVLFPPPSRLPHPSFLPFFPLSFLRRDRPPGTYVPTNSDANAHTLLRQGVTVFIIVLASSPMDTCICNSDTYLTVDAELV